jgi:protein phosphatase
MLKERKLLNQVKILGKTNIGKIRENNEDAYIIEIPEDPQLLQEKGILIGVADGVGGGPAGEIASKTGLETVKHHYYFVTQKQFVQINLRDALIEANNIIYTKANERDEYKNMATTIVVAVIRNEGSYIASIGDSRAYLLRKRKLTQLTKDHTWIWEAMDAGLISYKHAMNHPDKSVITRCLGAEPEVQIDLYFQPLRSDDILLLTTDGLTDEINEKKIRKVLRRNQPDLACQKLIDLALANGGHDNITCVVARIPSKNKSNYIRKILGWNNE